MTVEPAGSVQHAGTHLSAVEALMWTVDRDPVLSVTFGSITMLDRPPDMDRLSARMSRAMAAAPRLRQRVVDTPNPFASPQWCDDPDPDPAYHLRQVTLPPPGSIDQLHEFAATVVAEPFDRTRPLWQFWVVDGLVGGQVALVLKMHHTITDGVGGVRLWEQFIDFERHPRPDDPSGPDDPNGPDDPDDRSVANDPPVARNPMSDMTAPASRWRPVSAVATVTSAVATVTSAAGSVASAVATTARNGVTLAHQSSSSVLALVRHPSRATQLPARSLAVTRSTMRQVVVTDGSRSPMWAVRSMDRTVRTVDIDLSEARDAAHYLGGTINDLFVTAVAGACGAYHRECGMAVTDLRMAMPVSVRRDRVVGGNAFVPTRVLIPAGETNPERRFAQIHRVLTTVREEPVLALGDMVATLANLLPSAVAVRLARQQVGSVDFTTSNVRASATKLFIGGSRIEATYPMGPLGGTAFNASMLSYAGVINIGIHIDSGAIDDPDLLVDCLRAEVDALLAHNC